MDIDIKQRLDALLKKIEDQDSDTATLSPGISPLTEKLLLYLGVQLDNLDITTELEKLRDVEIEGPAHHQALVYDAEKEKWVNDYVEGGAAGATKLDELTDVRFSGLEDGESLVYDSASGKWINKMVDTSIFMEDIVDTDIEEPRSGQVLVYDGDEITWKNSDALISAESKISTLESADSAIKSSIESIAARATALETRAANLEQEYGQQQASLIVLSSQITYATHVAEGALNNEAAEYQTNVQYFPGDYCTYQYGLYRCIGNTSGAWNNAKWERVKVCDEIKLVKSSADSAIETANNAASSAASAWDKAENAIGVASSAANVAATALESAMTAYETAQSAASEAIKAAGVAESALTSASSAYTKAQSAITTAASAFGAAASAAFDAGVALSTASSAMNMASSAVATANSAISVASNAASTASSAISIADDAASLAATAVIEASEAKSSAQSAYTIASAARASADVAYTTASSAFDKATTAQTTAGSALEVAESAQTTASSALTTANSAKTAASSALATASSALSIANVAATDALNAVQLAQAANQQAVSATTTANSALTDAATAVTTANTAASDAATALATASDAETAAASAQTTASSALDTANLAQATASSALINADSAYRTAASALVAAQTKSDWNATTGISQILNKPTKLADFSDDSAHRLVSDTERANWNATSVFKELTTENLDNVKEVGFYVGKAGNTCVNKPSGVVQFGLQVVRLATDAVYYKQILTRPTSNPGDEYVRTCVSGTWGEWTKRVDFSGSYNDLTNKPTIPTVNNATLTIQKNGTTVSTFTANASSNVTANITVPQKTSELVNDSGFITDISGKVSKSGDTMTGELHSADCSIRIQNITAARVFSVEAASGGRVQLHYAASGNHGIYSYGYGDSLSDTTAFTQSPQWIICRGVDGKVFISNWASKGSSTQPIYINNEGSAAACTYSLEKSVPSDAIFTDEKVKIANDTSTNQSLRILLGTSNNDNTVTESVKKSTYLVFNPSTGVFYSPRAVINSTNTSVPFIIRTDGRSSIPQNGDDIALMTGAYKKNTTESEKYNNIISLIGNTSDNRSSVRFGSSTGATIITAGANAKNFPKAYSKHASDALWLAAHSEIHMYTNLTANAASEGGHIKINAGGITVERTDSGVGTTANAYIMLGNSVISSTTKGASKGVVRFYNQNSTGTATFYVNLDTNTLSRNQFIHLPNESGTIQLQSQWELHGIIECDGVNMEYETTLPDGVTGICMYTTDYVTASSFTDPLAILGTFSDSTEIYILRDVTSCFVVTDISHDGLWVNQISADDTWRPGITSLKGASAVIRTPVINKNSLKKIKIRTIFHLNPPPEGLNVAILIRRLA